MKKLIINDAKALLHTVEDSVYLVTPGIFMRYVQEHPQIRQEAKTANLPDWKYMQKQFERLKIHKKHKNGLNIWTSVVTGPRKTRKLNGYLLKDLHSLLEQDILVNNPYIRIIEPEKNVISIAKK